MLISVNIAFALLYFLALHACAYCVMQVYEPPRYMTVNTAIEQLLEVEASRKEGAYGEDTMCVGVARLGSEGQRIAAGTLAELLNVDFGPPLHSLIIAGDTHVIENEILAQFRTRPE